MSQGSQVGDMFIRFYGDDADIMTSFNRVDARGYAVARSLDVSARNSAASFAFIGSAARGMATAVATAAATVITVMSLIGVGALAAGFHMVGLASEAEDTASKFTTVFGEAADATSEKLDEMAQRLGKSRIELMQMASQTQDTFVPLGFARTVAADMSLAVTELAQDLASFSPEAGNSADAMASLQSALIGNHETMRKYGVIINDTVLSQQLMKMGIEGGTQAASEQQKILARLQLIMQGTTDSQGDLMRTSSSYTNTMDSFRSALKDVGIQLGSIVMPAVSLLVGKLRDLANWFVLNEATVTLWQDRSTAAMKFVIEGVQNLWTVVSNADLIWEAASLSIAEAMMKGYDHTKWFAENSWVMVEWFFTNFWEIASTFGQNYIQLWMNVFENFDTIVQSGMLILSGNTTRGMQDLVTTLTKDFKYVANSPEFKELQRTDFTNQWKDLTDRWAERTKERTKEVTQTLQEGTKLDFDALFAGVESRADSTAKKAKASISDLESVFQATLLARFETEDPSVRAIGDLTNVVARNEENEAARHRELVEAVTAAPGFITEG